MNLPLQSLVALTLLIAAAVASLPLLIGAPAARPDPGGAAISNARIPVVEGPGGVWYYRGEAISRPSLAALLRGSRSRQTLDYLPSAALSVAEVSASLRWLRRLHSGGAVLALPPEGEPARSGASTGAQPSQRRR